jgi:hypothetical protein
MFSNFNFQFLQPGDGDLNEKGARAVRDTSEQKRLRAPMINGSFTLLFLARAIIVMGLWMDVSQKKDWCCAFASVARRSKVIAHK